MCTSTGIARVHRIYSDPVVISCHIVGATFQEQRFDYCTIQEPVVYDGISKTSQNSHVAGILSTVSSMH